MSGPTVEGRPSAGSVIHSTINPKYFSLGLIAANLQDRKFFEERHLAYVLQQNVKSNINARLKPFQIETLDSPIPDCQRDDKALHGLLMTWFDIYDSACFGGGLRDLRDRVELHHYGKREIAPGGTETQESIAIFKPAGLGKIVINADFDSEVSVTWEQMFLGSLLHEMLHAFLYFYSCECHQCEAMIAASLGGIGKSGHGPVWIDSMVALGTALQERLNWQLIVGLRTSIAVEMMSSDWDPTLQQVIAWGESVALLQITRNRLINIQEEEKREAARKLEEAQKAQDQQTKAIFGLPADATQEQLAEERARREAQARKENEQKEQEAERREREREALARQVAQARLEKEQKEQQEQKQRDQERMRKEGEQRALRAFGLPADYLQIQDEAEVGRLMAQSIQTQNQKAEDPSRQQSQHADPKKDEIVLLRDRVLWRFRSGVTKKRK